MKATGSYYECSRIITQKPVKITSEKTLFLLLQTKESVYTFIALNPMFMKKNPSVRKSSSVLQSIKQIVHLLVESFESPQTKQFKRWKSYVAE
jgi:predicted AAA+ superfamily ATPase